MERKNSSEKCPSNEAKFKRKNSNISIKPSLINLNVENNPKIKIFQMLNKDNLSDKQSSHSSKSANRQKSAKEQQFLQKIKELHSDIQNDISITLNKKSIIGTFYQEQMDYAESTFNQMINQLETLRDQSISALKTQQVEQKQTLKNQELQMNHTQSELDRLKKYEKFDTNQIVLEQKLSFLQNLHAKCTKKKVRFKRIDILPLQEEIITIHEIKFDEIVQQEQQENQNDTVKIQKQSVQPVQEDVKSMERNFFDFVHQKIKSVEQNSQPKDFKRSLFV